MMTKLQTVAFNHTAPIDKAIDTYEARVVSLREQFKALREEALALSAMREVALFRNTQVEHVVRSIKNGTATIDALLKRVN